MNDLYTDIGFLSANKKGEQLCGDSVEVAWEDNSTCVVALADGLGSGVKACILSTLTAKIIATMMAQGMSLSECVQTVASTLPICSVRDIAYSTFSIIYIKENEDARLIQYDNPLIIFMRDGVRQDYPSTAVNIDGKTIYQSSIKLRPNDLLVCFSDGALHASEGMKLDFSWDRENIGDYLEAIYHEDNSAKEISTLLLDKCCDLYGGVMGDDTTVCTIKTRKRVQVNLLIGPPFSPDDVSSMFAIFFSKQGLKIVCGGTTSELASEYLGKPINSVVGTGGNKIPPISKLEGVDLVTEGAITLSYVLVYAKSYLTDNKKYGEWSTKKDGASQISRILFQQATDISFHVGRAVNPAHQVPGMPLSISDKIRIVDELAACLEKMGKNVKVGYY